MGLDRGVRLRVLREGAGRFQNLRQIPLLEGSFRQAEKVQKLPIPDEKFPS